MENVVSKSRKPKNEDPLPFLRKATTKFPFESSIGGQAAKRRAIALGPMDKIFQKERREELDLTITFFFYQNFISFNVARSPLFIEMCRALTQGAPSGYVPPGSEKLRTTLLTKAKKEVKKMLEPIVASWPISRVSIVSDGWTDPARHPIINFMVSSLNGPVFMKAVDTLGEYKDVQFVGELFIEVNEDVGVDSCVQIITDNAPVCKVVGTIVEVEYPQVFWTPCIVHSLNLALKSIASDVLWIDQVASKRMKDTVLDGAWWERVDLIIQIMDPIISLLRFADIDKPIPREVYEGWDSMIEFVRSIILQSECPEYETSPEAFYDTIHNILVSRWDKNCTHLHCLAHSLNPKYYNHEWLNGGPSRRFPPHMDGEISQGRKEAFRQIF
eukprot:PITA_10810